MKTLFIIVLLNTITYAQQIDYNSHDNYIAEGYDVVAYFNNTAIKGSKQFVMDYKGEKLKFSNQENMNYFKANPEKYFPQYGGWCAYAMAKTGEKVTINPKTFEIRNKKLYLFYNKFFTNTLNSWLKENPEKLRDKADANWKLKKYTN